MNAKSRFHGVLITYRRQADLEHFLGVLATQTRRLDTLVVVDNDADPDIEQLVRESAHVAGDVSYCPQSDNMGPAGGIDAGINTVLSFAHEDDWVVLLDDDDPPQRDDCLEMMQGLLATLSESDDRCAGVGMWGARLNKWTGRVRSDRSNDPEQVDYLPGSACSHYAVSALRRTGAPDPEMFFGFDDLELGLRIRDLGLHLYSTGRAREYGLAHMVDGRTTDPKAAPPTWRRYYSLRNLIIVLRAHGARRGAVFMSVAAGVAKPVANLVVRPAIGHANLRLNIRAIRDGWLGRSGKTIDPAIP